LSIQVIIPSRCRPEAASRCLAALSRQTLDHSLFEVLLVDDGSPEPLTVDTRSLPPTFRFRIAHQKQSGPAGARQLGARSGQAEILLFTDDDCVPAPDWVQHMARAVESHPHALVGGQTRNGAHSNRQARVNQLILDLVYQHFNPPGRPATFFASNNIACRRADFLELGGFDLDFPLPAAEDRDLCDRWRHRGWPLVLAPEAFVDHHHLQTITQFLRMYFRYGRGARILHEKRVSRGARGVRDDLGFHQGIPARVAPRLREAPLPERLRVIGLLLAWQLANAAGFFWEACFGGHGSSSAAPTNPSGPA
jgi:GT2 family glycosyltransferase